MTINCPHCRTALESQPEQVGSEAQCPSCQKTFIVPAPMAAAVPPLAMPLASAAALGETPEQALAALKLPAILLISGAAIGVIGGLLCVASAIGQATGYLPQQGRAVEPAGMVAAAMLFVFSSIASGVVILGAVKMLQGQGYTLAMTGAIIAIVPCVGPCFAVVSFPFGIWALVVLLRPAVKAAFR